MADDSIAWGGPPAIRIVFANRILGIVYDKIGAGEEIDVTLVLAVWFAEANRHLPGIGLMITSIDNGGPVSLEPVAERQRGMI